MDTTNEGEIVQRKIGTAVGLSLLMSGLGHLYCGRLVTGLAWALAATATLVVLFLALVVNLSATGGLVLLLACLAVYLAAAAHAGWDAAKVRHNYRLREYNRPIVYALVFLIGSAGSVTYALWVREKYVEAFVMRNNAMWPMLFSGDRMIVHKTAYADEPVQLGDVIAFRPLAAPDRTKVRRVIGLPGQTVEVRDGRIMVGSQPLEMRSSHPLPDGSERTMWRGDAREGHDYIAYGDASSYPATTVPPHHLLVLGDDRANAEEPELVPLVALKGRVTLVFWPANDWWRFGPR